MSERLGLKNFKSIVSRPFNNLIFRYITTCSYIFIFIFFQKFIFIIY